MILNKKQIISAPPVVEQQDLVKKILNFCDVTFCFSNYRYVCKSWNTAVEQLRFDCSVRPHYFYTLSKKMEENDEKIPIGVCKFLRAHNHLRTTNGSFETPMIRTVMLQHCTNLKKIFTLGRMRPVEIWNQILDASKSTLENLSMWNMPPNIFFPKLKILSLYFYEFRPNPGLLFDTILDNTPSLQQLQFSAPSEDLLWHIEEIYPERVIISHRVTLLDRYYIKLFIMERHDFAELLEKKFVNHIEYLQVNLWKCDGSTPSDESIWNEYVHYLQQFENLKGICLAKRYGGAKCGSWRNVEWKEVWGPRKETLKNFNLEIFDLDSFQTKIIELHNATGWIINLG